MPIGFRITREIIQGITSNIKSTKKLKLYSSMRLLNIFVDLCQNGMQKKSFLAILIEQGFEPSAADFISQVRHQAVHKEEVQLRKIEIFFSEILRFFYLKFWSPSINSNFVD